VALLRARLPVDATKAREELGVTFRPLSATIEDTAAWFVTEGRAPGVELAVSGDAPAEIRL